MPPFLGQFSYIRLLVQHQHKAERNTNNGIKKWDSEKGPVRVSFSNNGEEISFQPEYIDDWLSEKVFDIINQQMTKNCEEKFYMFLGKDGWGLGQDFLYILMSQPQKQGLQEAFGWQFHRPMNFREHLLDKSDWAN